MSDGSKQNVDKLLSGYVDGELSKRKYNELKRLMEHDPELAERCEELKRQRKLLNSMPVESAPEGLLDAVMATQERKFILNEYSAASVESEGAKHLFYRRALTAAMIFVLFGGLIGLVVAIVAPPKTGSSEGFAGKTELPDPAGFPDIGPAVVKKVETPTADSPVFRAELALKTEQAIAMNSFIIKRIFHHNLNDYIGPREVNGTTNTIRLTCGIDSIVALLEDIQSEWDKCKQADLSVYDHAFSKMIVIEHISARQLMKVFGEDKFYSRMQLARDFSDFNDMNPYGTRRIALDDESSEGAVKPELTSSSKDIKHPIDGGEKISLVIKVTGL